jgi:lipoprotein-anchoring transpeptidase ErfK/SrfK
VRGGVIALATASIVVGAAAWALTAQKPLADPAVATPRASPAASDRVFLTKAQIDQAIASGTLDRPVKSLLAVKAPLYFGDYSWDDRNVPAGPTWIRVDLGTQLMSVFRGGHEIGTALVVYGGDNKQTPAGKLHILGKARNHRSSLYDAEMPFTLRLTNDGVSIHASSVRWGAATHGCIGVPPPFAESLYNAAKLVDEVLVVGSPRRTS